MNTRLGLLLQRNEGLQYEQNNLYPNKTRRTSVYSTALNPSFSKQRKHYTTSDAWRDRCRSYLPEAAVRVVCIILVLGKPGSEILPRCRPTLTTYPAYYPTTSRGDKLRPTCFRTEFFHNQDGAYAERRVEGLMSTISSRSRRPRCLQHPGVEGKLVSFFTQMQARWDQ